jgi:YceI-like domain
LYKRAGIAVIALVLAACTAAPSRRGPAQPANSPADSLVALPAAGTYRIDAGQSELRLLVYRGGSLAYLGHNHVMVNHSVAGSVDVRAALSASSFSLSVPVAAFMVDDTTVRQQEGADFPGEISQEAKSGTLRNMLGAALLNGARFPMITVRSVSISNVSGPAVASLAISVAGHDSTVEAPFTLKGESGQLTATGAFELRQTAIGLTPYSLMGGALQVQDVMQVKFKFVALSH